MAHYHSNSWYQDHIQPAQYNSDSPVCYQSQKPKSVVPGQLCQAFRMPLLDACFSVASFNYKYGINFASSASTAAFNPTANSPFSLTPFQTSQFIRFQNSVIGTQAQFAGANGVLYSYMNGVPISTINSTCVPQAVTAIAQAIATLYQRGARKFLVYGQAAGGCMPVFLAYGGSQPKDNLGCLIDVNRVIQNFDSQLLATINSLRQSLRGVSIAYFDYYSAHIAILTNPASFGFTPNLTKTACCGAPGNGTLNFNPAITCGHPSLGSNNCANPDQYVIWDGIHFTISLALLSQCIDLGVDTGPTFQILNSSEKEREIALWPTKAKRIVLQSHCRTKAWEEFFPGPYSS